MYKWVLTIVHQYRCSQLYISYVGWTLFIVFKIYTLQVKREGLNKTNRMIKTMKNVDMKCKTWVFLNFIKRKITGNVKGVYK